MTVKDLIDKLKNFDPNLKIGGWDYFGDILDINDVWKPDTKNFVVLDIDADLTHSS